MTTFAWCVLAVVAYLVFFAFVMAACRTAKSSDEQMDPSRKLRAVRDERGQG